MRVDLPKRAFTVDEYYRMAEAGIFERERVELVNGEVVAMAPLGSRHAACVTRLQVLLMKLVGEDALVRIQNPLPLDSRTELESDLAVARFRADYYASAHPTPRDTLLLIEVAESSLQYDRDVKMPLYARAGVPEAWLVDLEAQQVVMYGKPSDQGYGRVATAGRDELLKSLVLPQIELSVQELLP
jgi:Uma2 family endonuclease